MKPLTHEEIIKRPIVMTEKSASARDAFNQYTFEVDRRANKLDIRDAVEALFKVDVAAVNVANYRGKFKRMGRGKSQLRDWKKAVVTLKEGESIDLFEGA